MIITINTKNPQPRLIRKVVDVLQKGGVIGYPTVTIYGVGCDLFNPEAVRKTRRLKKSGTNKSLSFIFPNFLKTVIKIVCSFRDFIC